MSISNDIRNLIDLQDENITFLPGSVERAEYKGQPCKFIHGDLTYDPITSVALTFSLKVK